MPAKLSPVFNQDSAQIDANGVPRNGAKLFTYIAGTSTKTAVYKDAAGTIPHTNPIILNSNGLPPDDIWILDGNVLDFVLAPANDTDPPGSPILTIEDVSGVNDALAAVSLSEWVDSGLTPTFISATSFSVAGDKTALFHPFRRLKLTVSAGTVYARISASSFGSGITTVTVVNDSGALDSGLTKVEYGIASHNNTSLPGYRLLKFEVFTTSGTWTKIAGCLAVDVEVVDGGGGGAGAASIANEVGLGGGGSGGGYRRRFIETGLGATETVTIGAGGAGGVGTNSGGSGGASGFGAHVPTANAGPGVGGQSLASGTSLAFGGAGSGGVPTGADTLIGGGHCGSYGTRVSGTVGIAGSGGSSHLGGGGRGAQAAGNNGSAGLGPGGGGGGALTQGLDTRTGGAGASGAVVVRSYG